MANVSWSTAFVIDASLAQEDTAAARMAAWAGVFVYTVGLGVHAARRWKGRYTRPYGLTLFALWVGHLLHAASLHDAPTYVANDGLLVASWAAGILADSHWFVALLHNSGPRTKTMTMTSTGLCVGTVLMVLLCEPVRVVHHVLDATLTLCALLVSLTRNPEDASLPFVRTAALARFACALGWMACDMPQYVARDVAPLHMFWSVANLTFVVSLLRSYRFRFANGYDLAKPGCGAGEAVPLFRVL